jgi:hypothetical protein
MSLRSSAGDHLEAYSHLEASQVQPPLAKHQALLWLPGTWPAFHLSQAAVVITKMPPWDGAVIVSHGIGV